jgi:DNA-binding transcriptional ArsR family regulator
MSSDLQPIEIDLNSILKVLAEPQRVEIIHSLSQSDSTVAELTEKTGLAQPTVSFHLKKLKETGLIGFRKMGKHRDYFLIVRPFQTLINWLELLSTNRQNMEQISSAYRSQTIDGFTKSNKKIMPSHPRKREIILLWLSEMLKPGEFYHLSTIEDLWSGYLTDWKTVLQELENLGQISGNGLYFINNNS